MTFGELLKDLRMKKGLSLRGLAKLTGIDSAYLSRIERSTCKPPQKEKILNKLFWKLGIGMVENDCEMLRDLSLVENLRMPKGSSQNIALPMLLRKIGDKKLETREIFKIIDFINEEY